MAFSCEKGKHLVEGRRALGLSLHDLDDLSHLQQNYVRAYLQLEKTDLEQNCGRGQLPLPEPEQERTALRGGEVTAPDVQAPRHKAVQPLGLPAQVQVQAQDPVPAASSLSGTVCGEEAPPLQEGENHAWALDVPAVLSRPNLVEASKQITRGNAEVRLEAQKSATPSLPGEQLTETFCFRRLTGGVPLVLTGSPSSSARASFLVVPLPPVSPLQPSGLAEPKHEEGQPAPGTSNAVPYSFLFLPVLEPPVASHQSRSESIAVSPEVDAAVQIYSARALTPAPLPLLAEPLPTSMATVTELDAGEKPVPLPSPIVHFPVSPVSSAAATVEPDVGAERACPSRKHRDKYYISGPDLVFAAIIALASTASRRHEELSESLESRSHEGSVVTTKVSPCSRPSLIVCHGDSLEAIAERHFNDRRLGHLVADLNESVICQCWLDGKRIVRIKVGQVLFLPLLEDITAFHSRCRNNRDMTRRKLVTIVEDTEVSREVLLETFKPFLKRLN